MFSWPDIAEAALGGLVSAASALDDEQAAHGLDSWDELRLHTPIAQGIAALGLGVIREQRFPGEPRSPVTTSERDRQRCDLVLTPHPGTQIYDNLRERKQLAAAAGTLFEETAALEAGEIARDEVTSDDAAWIEIKTVAQTTYRDGVPVPNGSYASELVRGPATDLKKLARNEGIVHAAALIVLFARDAETIRHDLSLVGHKLLDKNIELEDIVIRDAPMADRVGNGAVGVLVASLKRLRHD